MKYTLVGFGIEGRSTYNYLKILYPNAVFEIRDLTLPADLPEGVICHYGLDYLKNIDPESLVFRSPSIFSQTILAENPHLQKNHITHQIEYFLQHCPAMTIGVTGTKGKGTTSTLIKHIIQHSKKSVFLIGNIGVPALDILAQVTEDDIVVLELSSFQLMDIEISPHIAVVLRVTQEHLDIHRDIEEYQAAKLPIVKHQTSEDYAIINTMLPTSQRYCDVVQGRLISIDTTSIDKVIPIDGMRSVSVEKLLLKGKHNWENILPAIEVAKILNIDPEIIYEAIIRFEGLEHRLEYCGTYDGIEYYNDSFGTTPETAIVALQSFPKIPITLFLGGSDKGSDYTELCNVIAISSLKNVILIPTMGEMIWEQFTELYPKESQNIQTYEYPENMEDAVHLAHSITPQNGVVLLSCACASFSRFKNYKERGKLFKEAVEKLGA